MRDHLEEAKRLEEALSRAADDDQSETVTDEHQREPDPIELVNQAMASLPWLPEDKAFVCARLARLGIYGKQRRRVLKQYHAHWLEGSERETRPIRKDNAGRRAANLWLCELKRMAELKSALREKQR